MLVRRLVALASVDLPPGNQGSISRGLRESRLPFYAVPKPVSQLPPSGVSQEALVPDQRRVKISDKGQLTPLTSAAV